MSLILNVRQNVGLSTSREVSLTVAARGAPGLPGPAGPPGPPGPATIDVGTTTTGAPGSNASVVNSGTNIDAVLDFTIPRGDKGDQGDQGDPGQPGAPGTDGKSVLNGTGAPSNGTGNNGDFYIDTVTDTIYGPKAGGVWPTPGTSLVGPQGNPGTPGTPGTDGLSVLHGTGDPTSGDGVNGEFWINTTTNYIFGPKAAGAWPSPGTSLVGPQGPPGPGQDVSAATHEPLGHADRAESTISFNNTSRTFTIAPTGSTYEVWCAGTKYDLTTQSVTIPNTTGLYYIYFDTAGVLQYKTTYFDWPTEVPTSYVYWNSGTSKAEFFADERHGITLDWATHEYLHRTRGAAMASGFSLGSYTTAGTGGADADAQAALSSGTFFDEDLQVDVVATATPTANTWEQNLLFPMQVPVFYLDGTAWRSDTATNFPLKTGTARARYNLLTGSTWSTADAGNSDYVVSWLVATNNLNYPVMVILGQASYPSLPNARNALWESLTLTNFPVFEFRPLYKLIFQTATSYANTPHSRLRDVQDIRGSVSVGSGTTTSDHGLLNGLADDDHLQYALADGSRGSFDALGAAATVQTNLNTHTGLTTTAHGGIVPDSRTVSAGTGLTGGGALSANVTLTVAYGTTSTTAAVGNDTRIVNAVQTTRSITAGTGLSGGGDLSADRTLSVSFGNTSGTVAQGNDSRFTDSRTPYLNVESYGNANYQIVATTSAYIEPSATLTASRTITLPDASDVPQGAEIVVVAAAGVSQTNILSVAPTFGQFINGSSSAVQIKIPFGWRRLISNGADAWTTDVDALRPTVATTKGDLLVATAANTVTRLPVGTNNYVLTADSTTTEGVKWAAASGGGTTGYSFGIISTTRNVDASNSGLAVGAPAAVYTGTGANVTATVAVGSLVLTRAYHTGQTVTQVGFAFATASPFTVAGNAVVVGVYNDSNGSPTTLAWSQSFTIGTSASTSWLTTGLSKTMPSGPCWIAVINPSGNSGSGVAFRGAYVPLNTITLTNDNNNAVSLIAAQASLPADLSSNNFRTSSSASGQIVPTGAAFPKIGLWS